jgi:hypothetical protein
VAGRDGFIKQQEGFIVPADVVSFHVGVGAAAVDMGISIKATA